MKKTLIGLLLGLAAASAFAGVVNFDDLPGDGLTPIPDGYAGFTWTNMGTISSTVGAGTGFANGTVSPSNTAFNWYGATASITKTDGGSFTFTGAWFTSAFVDQEIAFEGWLQSQLLYTGGPYTLDTTTPVRVQLDWQGIDTLVIYNSSGTQWAMDDLATVPEPAALALFGVGLAGLLSARRRQG